jgi:hypothetical protein
LHGRVEVEPDLAPFGPVKMAVQFLPQRIPATDIQDGLGRDSAIAGQGYFGHCSVSRLRDDQTTAGINDETAGSGAH